MAAQGTRRTGAEGAGDSRARIAALVARHERALLRVARQSSLCHDDALDAYQRALEIFIRRVDTVDPATEVAWLKVVIRHEAMAIRRQRSDSVTGEELDLDAFVAGPERSVEERIASGERVRRSAEALRALKPDEARALMLKAHGLSYDEIGERNGWTYTKVNRAITEGRRHFLRAYEGIESGEECERFAPIVEALADGSATSAQLLEIRPHLRHCTACRATVRELHLSRRHRAVLFFPWFAAVAPAPGEPAPESVPSMEEVLEIDPAPAAESVGLVTRVKQELLSFFHRLGGPDLATGVHIATSSGGGRIATVAAVIGFCLSGVGTATVCVVTGLVPDPTGITRRADPPEPRERRAEKPRRPTAKRDHPPTPATPSLAAELAAVRPTPEPTPEPARERRPEPERTTPAVQETWTPASASNPAQDTTPQSHERPPISPAPTSSAPASTATTTSQTEFLPEPPPGPIEPAAAPATGGNEFAP